jgi:hypothetical protein
MPAICAAHFELQERAGGGATAPGTWANVSGNLPNAPVEMLTYEPVRNRLYAATDFGAYSVKASARNWTQVAGGLPQTSVLDVKTSGDGSAVYAATFGRGIWKAPAPR